MNFLLSKCKLLFLCFVLLQLPVLAQGLKGTIKSSAGEPLPFASIYISDLNAGSSTNLNGEYEIKLPAGKHTVLVQFIGYKTEQFQVETGNNWVLKDITLTEQGYTLSQVEIKSKSEDPANTIMRKAIAKSKYHLLQYTSYQVKVYIKGTGELTDVPFFLKRKLKEEGVPVNEAFTTESVSIINFQQPDKIKEKVISIRTSGKNSSGVSPMNYINQSFYNKNIAGSVSPLSPSAFSYYKFKYEGSFREGDVEINKIKVTPRSRGLSVFEGYIYIIENIWAIHSLDLKTTVQGFPIQAKQNFAEVLPQVWMPITHRYLIKGELLGFAGEYKYLASCSDYKIELNQDLLAKTQILDEKTDEIPENIKEIEINSDKPEQTLAQEKKLTRKQFRKMITAYEKESLKKEKEPEVIRERSSIIDSMATRRDSVYWDEIRPVPLTLKEMKGYERDDSLELIREAALTGKDSTGLIKRRKFGFTDLLLGEYYSFGPNKNFRLQPTLAQIYYNTVEGVNVNMSGIYTYNYDSLRQNLTVSPVIRYGFSSKDFYAKTTISHAVIQERNSRRIFAEGGKFVSQFNDNNPIHPHINTISTLFFRRNHMKIYEKSFVKGGVGFSPTAAISFSGNIEWAKRNLLFNTADYSLFYSDEREFTPSIPQNTALATTEFPNHEALIFSGSITYRPWLKYYIRNNKKIALTDNAPEINIVYKKGIKDLLSSDINFDFVQLGFSHQHQFGVSGSLFYHVNGGAFLNNKQVYFMDYKHFNGNKTIFTSQQETGSYRLLDYYTFSTNNRFVSAMAYYQFRKFLITQLPEVRFSGIKENIFVNYLKTSHSPNYYEVGYSLDNILKIFRVEFATSFYNRDFKDSGFRISLGSLIKIN